MMTDEDSVPEMRIWSKKSLDIFMKRYAPIATKSRKAKNICYELQISIYERNTSNRIRYKRVFEFYEYTTFHK